MHNVHVTFLYTKVLSCPVSKTCVVHCCDQESLWRCLKAIKPRIRTAPMTGGMRYGGDACFSSCPCV